MKWYYEYDLQDKSNHQNWSTAWASSFPIFPLQGSRVSAHDLGWKVSHAWEQRLQSAYELTFESSHFLGFFPLQCLLMSWPFLWTTGLASLPKLELTVTDQFTLLQRNQCAEMLRKKYITQRWHFCSHCQATWQCQNQGLSNHGSLSGKPHKPCSKRSNSLTEISKTAVTRSILEYPWVTFTLTTLACLIGDVSWCFTEFCDAMPSHAVKGRQVELQPWEPVDNGTTRQEIDKLMAHPAVSTRFISTRFNMFRHIPTMFQLQ